MPLYLHSNGDPGVAINKKSKQPISIQLSGYPCLL